MIYSTSIFADPAIVFPALLILALSGPSICLVLTRMFPRSDTARRAVMMRRQHN